MSKIELIKQLEDVRKSIDEAVEKARNFVQTTEWEKYPDIKRIKDQTIVYLIPWLESYAYDSGQPGSIEESIQYIERRM